eukprot:2287350-Pleurochrysis_carterae.AAC.2
MGRRLQEQISCCSRSTASNKRRTTGLPSRPSVTSEWRHQSSQLESSSFLLAGELARHLCAFVEKPFKSNEIRRLEGDSVRKQYKRLV